MRHALVRCGRLGEECFQVVFGVADTTEQGLHDAVCPVGCGVVVGANGRCFVDQRHVHPTCPRDVDLRTEKPGLLGALQKSVEVGDVAGVDSSLGRGVEVDQLPGRPPIDFQVEGGDGQLIQGDQRGSCVGVRTGDGVAELRIDDVDESISEIVTGGEAAVHGGACHARSSGHGFEARRRVGREHLLRSDEDADDRLLGVGA